MDHAKEATMGNVEVVKGVYEAFGRGDIPSVLAAFDPDIEWREAEGNPYEPEGNPWFGGDAITQNLFMRLGSEWDSFTVSPKEFHDAGDTVVVECRYTGAYNATGKSLDAQVCHVWKLRDGKITSFQQYLDTAQVQDVMGVRAGVGQAAETSPA
jgi:ketosteroid isomerase-like protein